MRKQSYCSPSKRNKCFPDPQSDHYEDYTTFRAIQFIWNKVGRVQISDQLEPDAEDWAKKLKQNHLDSRIKTLAQLTQPIPTMAQ